MSYSGNQNEAVLRQLDLLLRKAAKASGGAHALLVTIKPDGGENADVLVTGHHITNSEVAFICHTLLGEIVNIRARAVTCCEQCDGLAARARQAADLLMGGRSTFRCDA